MHGSYGVVVREELRSATESVWTADHPQLSGCVATGRTEDEAVENLAKSRDAWLSWARAHSVPIPAPSETVSVTVIYAPRPASAAESSLNIGSTMIFEPKVGGVGA
jgi:predicted RNase H-like HicB family nuclease